MDRIIGVFASVPQSRTRHDGDLSDRLCYPYSAVLFSIFAIVVSSKQFVGDPIQCWVPAHFSGNQADYANDYCWLGNTYYLPLDGTIPREATEGTAEDSNLSKAQQTVSYYHWIPMVLLVQALFFYFPKSIWRFLCRRSGLDVEDIVHASQSFIHLELEETREKTMKFMTRQLDRYLALANRKPSDFDTKKWFDRTRSHLTQIRGWYLTVAYLFVKLLSMANVLGQLFLLNVFLGTGFHWYGFEILNKIFRGEDNDGALSPRFPRVTMCNFKIRRLGATHRYTVQCVLPINLFNEKIFLFVWLWLVFLMVALGLSLVKWMLRILLMPSRRHYIEGHLSLIPKDIRSHSSDSDKLRISRFLRQYLHYDGVFVLRLIGHNTSSITVIELAICLWDNFRKKNLIDGDTLMTPPPPPSPHDLQRTFNQKKH